MNVVPFEPKHLEAILALCSDEGWTSFVADRDRTLRVLTAAGVTAVVAIENDEVLGFAYVQSDGAIQAHLSLIAVSRAHRRRGIGRRLIREAFARCGAERIDLVSTEGNDAFYESFTHRRFPGYRIYPGESGGPGN
jgi:ribosomal protein S18 acetylase RimI-like enzyme